MKVTLLVTVVLRLFPGGNYTLAKPTIFKNDRLKNEIVVELDVIGNDASGTISSQPYDEDGPKVPFTAKLIATPKGKSGVYVVIKIRPHASLRRSARRETLVSPLKDCRPPRPSLHTDAATQLRRQKRRNESWPMSSSSL